MMLVEIMNYTQVADARVVEAFEKNESVPTKAITLFSHVLNAQHIWASRILGKPSIVYRLGRTFTLGLRKHS